MQAQYQQELKQLLQKLHLNSIDELLQLQPFTTEKVASRCNMHSIVVEQYLLRLHQIALRTQLLDKKVIPEGQPVLIEFDKIYPGIGFSLQEGDLLEVLGRANGGKTTLVINCIKQALSKNIQPILLSSSTFCTQQYLQNIDKQKLMIFQFENIGQLAMLIHIIGNQILSRHTQYPQKYLLFIDCLSQIDHQDQTIQFDSSQKFRRLINTFTTRTHTSIVYTYRVNSSLFPTQYKRDHHRPKCKNSKEWDGWANKNCMVDWVGRKRDKRVICRVTFPKGLQNKVYEVFM